MESTTLLSIKDLKVSFEKREVLHSISLDIPKNSIVGVVGESGSGKSLTALSIMGLLSKKNCSVEGEILFNQQDLTQLSQKSLQKIRGNQIGMIFQEPMSSLNPSIRCGKQVLEIILQHQKKTPKEAKQKVLHLFEKVQLPTPERIYKSYPHQLSGGQKQRVMIAMAMACDPQLLIADEPTTALDVTVQKEIIQLIRELQAQHSMSVLFISHDLGLIRQIADKTLVMYKGNIVEQGHTQQVIDNPLHSYTKALLSARPQSHQRLKRLPTVQDFLNQTPNDTIVSPFERAILHQKIYEKLPLLEIQNLCKTYVQTQGNWFSKISEVKAVNDISIKIYEGETLGLVGESGCGKSTLGRMLVRLEQASAGNILYKGTDITSLKGKPLRELRKEIQIIFQDPYSSLNPTQRIGEAIGEPMKVHRLYGNTQSRKERVLYLLEKVGLEPTHYDRYPHEFSGGQRQRIGIARALAVEPKLIVCDESVSALDVSVQAQVLNLLNELKEEFGFTYLFISHDLSVVQYMSDRVAVMKNGRIVEVEEADTLYKNPKNDYTQKLINSIF